MKDRRKNDRRQLATIDSRQMDSLRVFHEVARALTSNLELDSLLRSIMAKMEEFFGPEHWSLLMFDEETSELYYALSAGLDETLLRDLRLGPGEGIAGYVAATGIRPPRAESALDRVSTDSSRRPHARHPAVEQLGARPAARIVDCSASRTLRLRCNRSRKCAPREVDSTPQHHRRLYRPVQRTPLIHFA